MSQPMPAIPLNGPLRVTAIEVDSLFGLYSHKVILNATDRVTIIHGPNGVGKTALLRLVHALFAGRLDECLRAPMRQLEVALSDGRVCGIRPERTTTIISRSSVSGSRLTGVVYCIENGVETAGQISFDPRELISWAHKFGEDSPYHFRLDTDRWLDRRDDTVSTSLELFALYQDRVPEDARTRMVVEPEWFAQLRKRVSVHIIETQRLLRLGRTEIVPQRARDGREWLNTVREYARDLARRIRDASTAYATISQRLDQTFPRRLLEGPDTPFSVDALKARMEQLEQNRERLKTIGLLDPQYVYPFNPDTLDNVDPTKQGAMTLYVEDTAQKLGVFDDLARRIEALLSNVNGKFRNVTIAVNREEGLVAWARQSRRLDLDSLSSGEQHELVLLYDLLFRVDPNTLILIDEPELSLHITWQKRFLADMLEIVQISNCDVLLATHSIFIAGDRPDLMVALTEETG